VVQEAVLKGNVNINPHKVEAPDEEEDNAATIRHILK
jgi:hypothetical protein